MWHVSYRVYAQFTIEIVVKARHLSAPKQEGGGKAVVNVFIYILIITLHPIYQVIFPPKSPKLLMNSSVIQRLFSIKVALEATNAKFLRRMLKHFVIKN